MGLILTSVPRPATASSNWAADGGKDPSIESSRELSGKPFRELQNKAREVKLDFVVHPSNSVPIKLSEPAKKKALASAVKRLPDEQLEQLPAAIQRERYELLGTAMDLTMLGVGVVYGGLAFGPPGAVIGGAITYTIWQVSKSRY